MPEEGDSFELRYLFTLIEWKDQVKPSEIEAACKETSRLINEKFDELFRRDRLDQ